MPLYQFSAEVVYIPVVFVEQNCEAVQVDCSGQADEVEMIEQADWQSDMTEGSFGR